MNLSERLQYCKICQKRSFDRSVGIICSLTNAKPEFEEKCENFQIDEAEAKLVLEKNQQRAQIESESGYFAPEKKGMKKGVVGGIVMIAIAVVWFFAGLVGGIIFYYPPILAVIGIVAIVKGIIEGNVSGERYKNAA